MLINCAAISRVVPHDTFTNSLIDTGLVAVAEDRRSLISQGPISVVGPHAQYKNKSRSVWGVESFRDDAKTAAERALSGILIHTLGEK